MFGQKKVVYKRIMGCSRPALKRKDKDDELDAMFEFGNDDDD
jgi:hypothetical protein